MQIIFRIKHTKFVTKQKKHPKGKLFTYIAYLLMVEAHKPRKRLNLSKFGGQNSPLIKHSLWGLKPYGDSHKSYILDLSMCLSCHLTKAKSKTYI